MNNESQEQIKYLIIIGGAALSLAGAVIGYVLKVMRNISNNKIETLQKNSEFEKSITEHSKDIEFLKMSNSATQKKIELIIDDLKKLEIHQVEATQILKDVRRDIETIIQRGLK